MNELQSIDLFERLRLWVLERRPTAEAELRAMEAEATRRLSVEDPRSLTLAAFLGIEENTAATRRALRRLAEQVTASASAPATSNARSRRIASGTPAPPPSNSPASPTWELAFSEQEGRVGEDALPLSVRPLSPLRARQIQRLWAWVETQSSERPAPPEGAPSPLLPAVESNETRFGLHEKVSPEARVRSLREALPFLKGLAPYRILESLGFDCAPPDLPRQRLLFRLGFVTVSPGGGEQSHRETFEAMTRLGRWAGESLRGVGYFLGLFAGAGAGNRNTTGGGGPTGSAVARLDERVAVCRAHPLCSHCPLRSLCLFERFDAGKEGGGANRRTGAIKTWAVDDRPRERMARSGPQMLADADLLAVILRSGTGGKSAVELARAVLAHFETLERLDQAPLREIEALDGIGPAKAAEIKAALELGKRVLRSPLATGRRLTSSRDVYQAMQSALVGQMREQFLLLALNTKNEILRVLTISIGNLSQSLVHPREVFREAIREAAASVMLIHNHPSGDPTPSRDDEIITQRLCRAGELLGIRVLDHIIVGRDRYYSFADEGRLGTGA